MHTIHATSITTAYWLTLLLGLLTALPAVAATATLAAADSSQATQIAQQNSTPKQTQTRTVTIINVTAAQAARSARHEYGGKVLGVRLEQTDNKPPFYRVRLISRGRVHVVSVNAHK